MLSLNISIKYSKDNLMPNLYRAVFCFSLLIFVSCAFNVATPPTSFGQHVVPAVLEKGTSKIEITNQVHGEIFGPTVITTGIASNYGLSEKVELKRSLFIGYIDNQGPPILKRTLAGINVGGQYNPFGNCFGTFYGAGFGISNYAKFVSINFGNVLGYENRYLVPYLKYEVYFSQPFDTKDIRGGEGYDIFKKPTQTYGILGTSGLNAKFSDRVNGFVEIGLSQSISKTDELTMLGVGAGMGFKF